jgi:diguanylate cyclase (GGDEF)-like protein
VVLVENVDELYRGGTIAAKILDALAAPFLRERNPLYLTTSIGISIYPADGHDADTLVRKADMAMYRVKHAGRDGYRYYSDEMNLHAMHGLSTAQ